MIRRRRLRPPVHLFFAVALLIGAGGAVGASARADHFPARSDAVVGAAGILGPGTGAAHDPRLQRDADAGPSHRPSRHDTLGAASSLGPQSTPSFGAVAGIAERAGHPERLGAIRRRGPPGASA